MMKNNKEKLIDKVINGFKYLKGKASFYCFNKDIIPEIIHNIIVPLHNKHTNASIFIIVDCYETRKNIMNYLNNNNINKDNGYNINCLSIDYIKPNYSYSYLLNIIVGVNDNYDIIKKLSNESKFTLSILTKNIMNNDFINNVRTILPSIDVSNLDIAVKSDNILLPVEEHRYGVDMSDEDIEKYNKCTKYINNAISIFGDLSNIEKCKNGDTVLGVSSIDFRYNIAYENGWREDLDTTIPYMKEIDDNFNPNILFQNACNFYTIAKERRDIVSNNIAKFEIIKNICTKNNGKQIIIVSKSGEYAAQITKYLNKHSIKCGDYHDCIENAIAIDEYGVPILVKTGSKKGTPKIIGAKAQSSINEKQFNDKTINVLSIKLSSNVKLKTACDILISTSPLYANSISIKKRFANVAFNGAITEFYNIYCNNTIESNKLLKEKTNNIVHIINETENFATYDENSGDIMV